MYCLSYCVCEVAGRLSRACPESTFQHATACVHQNLASHANHAGKCHSLFPSFLSHRAFRKSSPSAHLLHSFGPSFFSPFLHPLSDFLHRSPPVRILTSIGSASNQPLAAASRLQNIENSARHSGAAYTSTCLIFLHLLPLPLPMVLNPQLEALTFSTFHWSYAR